MPSYLQPGPVHVLGQFDTNSVGDNEGIIRIDLWGEEAAGSPQEAGVGRDQKAEPKANRESTYLGRHRTHTFHRKPQQKELLTWAAVWRREEVGVAAGGPSYLVFCKRQSRSHAWLFRKCGNAVQRQKQSRPGDTTLLHPLHWVASPRGADSVEGTGEQEAWSGGWRPDWEPGAAPCSSGTILSSWIPGRPENAACLGLPT